MPDKHVKSVREKPILFSAPMVKAILNGTKTQTRRIIKPQPPKEFDALYGGINGPFWMRTGAEHEDSWPPQYPNGRGFLPCPYGAPSHELFVKETWRTKSQWDGLKPSELPIANEFMVSPFIAYDADGPSRELHGKTRPSIFMPRWASRITLEIESVRVERLQDISEEDAIAEGCKDWMEPWRPGSLSARVLYSKLWESINGPGSWAKNPWVWALNFKRVEEPK